MATQATERFLTVSVKTLFGAGSASFELYARRNGGQPFLFRARTAHLNDDDLSALLKSGVSTLLIGYDDLPVYEEHLHARLAASDGLSLEERYGMLTAATRSVFESAMRGEGVAGVTRAVSVAEGFGTQLADTMCGQKLILRDVFELMLHDYYTFTHAANVATYCLTLAQCLGIDDRDSLAQIATGALLHDIGKRHIPRYILNKPGKLSDAEYADIQRHSQIGFEELSGNPKLSWGQLMMVYQHHERLDGRGYPVGIVDDEIHPWAKICAVADVFDALTCDRPHRSAIPVREARDYLMKNAGRGFDKEAVRCLEVMMPAV